MRTFLFSMLVTLLVLWTGFVWMTFFQTVANIHAAQARGAMGTAETAVNAFVGGSFFATMIYWCLGVIPLGVFAMIARPEIRD